MPGMPNPLPYAIKGFDEGLYFGRLLAENNLKDMDANRFYRLK